MRFILFNVVGTYRPLLLLCRLLRCRVRRPLFGKLPTNKLGFILGICRRCVRLVIFRYRRLVLGLVRCRRVRVLFGRLVLVNLLVDVGLIGCRRRYL